ncbi:phosphatidate cytidylyltransferase [Weissella muntiaci]|jgi:phosphatidate cytidylyltransferase|uniref:Phosphatidate cytidylyltransferase n=1 Tax=Weissella muntiaci TaxID=2508881 RepID=A0A6C2C8P3_9LACO|nr:phosphatidate cytidylyltransferase [Weissella muntiaci]TYC50307.1 phosphatidate cytidylyltransferase [Weissella muntiaci]
MRQRVITAVIALALFIPTIFYGGWLLQVVMSVLAAIAVGEVAQMRRMLLVSFGAILAMLGAIFATLPNNFFEGLPTILHPAGLLYIFVLLMLFHTVLAKNSFSFEDAGVFTLAMLYVGLGFHFFIDARNAGLDTLFYMLLIVWITDSAAYMVGRKFGKHPLTKISPKKTWEGSVGGTLIATVIVSIYTFFFPQTYGWATMLLITLVLSIAGQFGDLIESALKRFYKVKDSGNILPGHGGILDRFDSMLIVLPIMFIFGLLK